MPIYADGLPVRPEDDTARWRIDEAGAMRCLWHTAHATFERGAGMGLEDITPPMVEVALRYLADHDVHQVAGTFRAVLRDALAMDAAIITARSQAAWGRAL